MSALRTCIDCGLAAFDADDLEMYVKRSRGKYGRENLCKECNNKRQRTYRNEHKEQIKQINRRYYIKHREEILQRKDWRWRKQLELITAKGGMPLTCWYCGKLITKRGGFVSESLVFHSVDGNHENWDLENKVPVHRGCHSRLHTEDRTGVAFEERRVMINKKAEALFRKGVKPGDITRWLVTETGVPYSTVCRYLDQKYKHPIFRKGN